MACPATTAARACCDHLAEQALANALDLAYATTVAAGDRLGAFTGARGITVVTRDWQFQLDGDLVAEHCLLEREIGNGLEVLSARRAARAPASATAATKWASA